MAERRERVIVEAVDNFTTPMARMAAAAALLDKRLNDIDGSSVAARDGIGGVNDEVDRSSPLFTQASKDIDRYSGRLRLLGEAAITLGPALVPIGAAAVPAVTALTAGLGAAAGAAATALLAFNGMGDALSTISDYQLEPTTANLEKMQAALSEVGPAGADFARYLTSLAPALDELQNIARAGLLPGLAAGIDALMARLPEVQNLVGEIGASLGQLGTDVGANLASDRFDAFFSYLDTDAVPTLEAFARSTGNVAEGLAHLLVAFAPLNRDFTSGMESMTRAFADWAQGLSETDGFRDFVAYVRESGPQVIELLGALSNAFVGIIRAAAPVGQVVVPALTAFANVLAAIANSPIGAPLFTVAAALVAINRAVTLTTSGLDRLGVSSERAGRGLAGVARTAGSIAAVGIAVGAIADGIDRIDTQNLDRSLAALGRGEATETIDKVIYSLTELNSAANAVDLGEIITLGGVFGDSTLDKLADNVDEVDQSLARLVETGDRVQADALFAEIVRLAGEAGVSVEDVEDSFDAYALAVRNAEEATDGYVESVDSAARVNRLTRAQVNGLNAAMEEQVSMALGAFDAVTQYARALKDAQAQAKRNDAGLDVSTEAGRRNRDALSQLAAAWNSQGDAVRNNVSKWREARAEFIKTAEDMGATSRQAGNLADRLMEIPRQRQIDIKLYGSEEAANRIEAIRRQAEGLEGTRYINFVVTQTNAINRGFDPTTGLGRADGGTIPKDGKPYADRYLYMLAPGEEVISNRRGQADRFRPLLKAINNAADGATVGGRRSLDQMLEIAYARQQIRDLRRSLNRDGKDNLEGLNRRIAELELRRAQKELRLAEKAEAREARETNRAVRRAARGFDLDAAMSGADVRGAFRDLAREVREAGGELPRNFDKLRARAVRLAQRLGSLTEEYEETSRALEDLRASAADFSTQVGGIFNNNIYAQGGLANAMLQLQADANDTAERDSLLRAIAALGIDTSSDAFRSLASSADMQTLRDLDTLPELKAFEAWFAQRASAQGAAGSWASNAVYGAEITAMADSVASMQSTIEQMTANLERIQGEAAEKIATKTAQATGWSTYAGTSAGAKDGVAAGLANQSKKNNSKARTR